MEKRFSSMIQDSAKGSLILIVGQMISTAISAIGAIIVARILGSTSFGLIAIATIPVNITLLLIHNGVSSALINYMVEDRHIRDGENIHQIIFTAFSINLIIGTIFTILLYSLSRVIAIQVFSQPELTRLIQVLSIIILGQALFTTSLAVLVGFEKMTHRSITSITLSVFKSIIGPTLVYLGYNAVGAAYGYSAPYLFAGIFGFILVLFNFRPNVQVHFSRYYFNQIINYSRPLFFSNLLAGSFRHVLNFILPFYVSISEMGNYNASTSFTSLVTFFLVPISVSTFPLLSKLKPEDTVMEFVFQSIIKYKALITFPVAAAVIALSEQLVNLLFGSDYIYTPFFVRVLMIDYFFIGFGNTVSGGLLNSQKKTEITFRTILIYLFLGVPMGLLLIPRYGILGFQATIILAPKLGLIYGLWWIRKNWGLKIDILSTFKIFASTFLAFIGCYLVLEIVVTNPLIEILLGGVILALIYFLSILKTGALTKQNLHDIYNMINRYRSLGWIIEPLFKVMIKLTHN
jgi:O-antigen/teichoic acid export membrane protein